MNLFQNNNNYCKISVKHEYQNIKISFKCCLKENKNTRTNAAIEESKPNEKKEDEESELLDKKQK